MGVDSAYIHYGADQRNEDPNRDPLLFLDECRDLRAPVGVGTFTAQDGQRAMLGGADIVVARYDYDGRLVWARRAGGTGLDLATSGLVALDGFTLSTGAFENRAVFGPGEDNQTFLRSHGDWDFFLMKLGP